MRRINSPTWRATAIRCQIIERIYGSGNFDDAGDDLIAALRLASDYPDRFRYRFNFDTSHPNLWYHTMIFEIEGIPDAAYERFIERVAALGLVEGLAEALERPALP